MKIKKNVLVCLCFLVSIGIAQGKETTNDLKMKETETIETMKTIKVKKELIINAPAIEILRLVCPVLEYDWIPEWKCKLVNCPNGINEKGVVFKENMSSPFVQNKIGRYTTWTTLEFDTTNYIVHFKWDNSISSSNYKIKMIPIDETHTKCLFDLDFNIVNEKGMKSINENTEYKINFMIEGLGAMLKYYSENKELIDTKDSERKAQFVEKLSLAEKLKFLSNNLVMKLRYDRNRKSYLNYGVVSEKSLQLK